MMLNPTTSEKIDAVALYGEQNKHLLPTYSFFSFFFFCISSSNLPYQTGIKRRGNINLWSGDTREVSGLVAIPCLQLVSKLAISKEASPLQEWDLS